MRSHAATGEPIRRAWSEVPYGEEEIMGLEEELLPAMAALLERVGEIDRRLEGQSLGVAEEDAGHGARGCWGQAMPAGHQQHHGNAGACRHQQLA